LLLPIFHWKDQTSLTKSLKSGLEGHHFSNLKLLFFGWWCKPASQIMGVWSFRILGRALAWAKGKIASKLVVQKNLIYSAHDKILLIITPT
jgi:hypothetical protein